MKAIITGASSGMGAEYARQLAQRNYDVVLVARSKDKLEKLAKQIRIESKVEATVFPANLTNEKDLDRIIELAPQADLLINNAGVTWLHDYKQETIDKTVFGTKLNILAPTKLTLGFVKIFKERNRGRVINVGSTGAYGKSSPPFASYGPGKLYVERFTRSVRHDLELEKSAVKLHLVHPGSIGTEIYTNNNLDTGSKPIPSTPVDKFVKVVLHRILDKGRKEFHYGKLGTTQKIMGRLTSAKFQARIQKKMTADYYK